MRIPRLTADDYSSRQRQVTDRIAARRGQVRGPFQCLLHSPDLFERVESLASYVRMDSPLPARLREFALLIAARFWDAQDSWNAHVDKAVAAGIAPEIVEALAARRAPPFADEDERVFYRFCKELLEDHFVGDDTYAAAQAIFGDTGLVEAVGCLGTFSLLAFYLNAFEVDPDPTKPAPFADVHGFRRTGEDARLG